ncbi:MAG: hypothetical protein RBS17_08970 [Coriobacteriia bacterium]|nr:hypothetical protein [Coriobacteriia bacterium]
MKNLYRISLLMLVVAMLATITVFSTGCAKEEPVAEEPVEEPVAEEPVEEPVVDIVAGEAVVNGTCSSCHDVTRTYLYMLNEGTDWDELVSTMEDAHGAVLTEQEKTAVVAFLESREPTEAETLIQGKCTTCHDMSQLYVEAYGPSWETILDTMVTEHGAELTEAEQQAVLDYLENR